MAALIDWVGLMRSALSPPPAGLGLLPEDFWRLTPMELRMMLGREQAATPLSRARLAELVAAFPDRQGETDGGGRKL